MNSYFNAVREQMKDWKVAVIVLILTVARIIYGWAWVVSGSGKIGWLTDGKINAAGKIQAMITNLAGPEVTRYDPLLINKAFAWVAQNVFLGMPALTDALVVIFEIGIGIAMILGLGVFWAALAAMFLNTQFIAGASFINFGYIWTNLIMVLFARHAELLGLGGYIRYLRTGDALPGSKRKTEMRERY